MKFGETFVLRFVQHQQFSGAMLRNCGGAVCLMREKGDFTKQVSAFNGPRAAIRVSQRQTTGAQDIQFM